MKNKIFLIALAVIFLMPNFGEAASIKNEDNKVYEVKGRKPGKDWVYRVINPRGALYFDCRFGCEIAIEETGATITLEEDADVVIRHGELKVR